jgi:hypothetical protein
MLYMFFYTYGPGFAVRPVMIIRRLQKYAGNALAITIVAAPLAFIAVAAVQGYAICRQHNMVLKKNGDTNPDHQCNAPILSKLRKMFAASKFT